MRYVTTLKGEKDPQAVEIEALGGGRYAVTLPGKDGDTPHEVDAYTLDHGAISLLVDGHSYNVEIEERGDEVAVSLRGELHRVDVANERQLKLRVGAVSASLEGKQLIQAPMPGKVVKVLVKVGDVVTEGQGLVVVEAMKMENELKSPKAGTVTGLFVQEGATVELNAKLVTVE